MFDTVIDLLDRRRNRDTAGQNRGILGLLDDDDRDDRRPDDRRRFDQHDDDDWDEEPYRRERPGRRAFDWD